MAQEATSIIRISCLAAMIPLWLAPAGLFASRISSPTKVSSSGLNLDAPLPPTDAFGLPLITFRCTSCPAQLVAAQIYESFGITFVFKGKAANKKISILSNADTIRDFVDGLAADNDWIWAKTSERCFEFMDRAAAEAAANTVQGSSTATSATDEFGLPLITFRCNQVPTHMFTARIKEEYDITILFKGKSAGQKITLQANGATLLEVLNKLVEGLDWVWVRQSERYFEIMDRAYFERFKFGVCNRQLQDKTLDINGVSAFRFAKAIEGMINKRIGESVTADDRAKKVHLHALPQTLEQIEGPFHHEPSQPTNVTRIFTICHTDTATIYKRVLPLASNIGTVDLDADNHRIIVIDKPLNIRVIDHRIRVWDVDQR